MNNVENEMEGQQKIYEVLRRRLSEKPHFRLNSQLDNRILDQWYYSINMMMYMLLCERTVRRLKMWVEQLR